MEQIFPHANIIAGILAIVVGFLFHWLGQLISLINWEFATKIGIQEKGMPEEFKAYEYGLAVADVATGWIHGIIGVGLILSTQWSYKFAWITTAMLLYHGISFWFWTGKTKKLGYHITPDSTRIGWFIINIITGILIVMVAWKAF